MCSWQPAGLRVLAVVRCSRTVTFAHGWACACVPSQPSLTFPVCAGAFSGEPPATATTAGALTPTASRGPISGVAGRYGSESVHAVQCAAWLRVWLRDCCLGLICATADLPLPCTPADASCCACLPRDPLTTSGVIARAGHRQTTSTSSWDAPPRK